MRLHGRTGAACRPTLWMAMTLSAAATTYGPADVAGEPFPAVSIVLVTIITLVLASFIGGLAMWKHEELEAGTEAAFERVGGCIGSNPFKFILGSLLVVLCCGGGFALQKDETDPSKSWVPAGSVVLDHQEIVENSWPAEARYEVVLSHAPGGPSANMLTPAMVQALYEDMAAVMNYQVNGQSIINANEGDAKNDAQQYDGLWTFDGRSSTQTKCFKFDGQTCAFQSILAIFGSAQNPLGDFGIIGTLDQNTIDTRIASWEAAPKDSMVPSLGIWKSFELDAVLGGITRNSSGSIVSATVLRTAFFLTYQRAFVRAHAKDEARAGCDPVADLWEANLVCTLGFVEEHSYTGSSCPSSSGVEHTGQAGRSLGDEFGGAIRNDIGFVALSYFLIIVYLFVNLGRRDKVHSMFGMSAAGIGVVGCAYALANGFGGYFGVKVTPLNNNIPFLILGLGVDDAFVLVSEFTRHSVDNAGMSVEDRIRMTARSGGLSVLVTSLTDALTFLIGATTVLPALSSFCIYAGIAVAGCFVFMMTLFLPLLAYNAKRAEANRFDCVCCFQSKVEHKLEEPHGWCSCIAGCGEMQPRNGVIERACVKFMTVMSKTLPGKVSTMVVFGILFIVGFSGICQLRKEFRLDWFFPEGSYVRDYMALNDQYFRRGVSFTVYVHSVNVYEKRSQLDAVDDYLNAQNFVLKNNDGTMATSWWSQFIANNASSVSTEADFYNALYACAGPTTIYAGRVKWVDSSNPQMGVADMKILDATLKSFEGAGSGQERYEVYYTMRNDIADIVGTDDVFPYSFEFLYWEEVGVIDSELIRNLIIAFGVMCAIIAVLIPKPRIALFVAVNIGLAIAEVIGFSHYWGLTMNGVSTIYFLMCAGFSVDYSAHIAHAFNSAKGAAPDRAVEALKRLGPSVFHAIISTFLAVIVLSGSTSFVFEIFFKILFLVCVIAGGHGMWLLPVMLSLVGEDSEPDGAPQAETSATSLETTETVIPAAKKSDALAWLDAGKKQLDALKEVEGTFQDSTPIGG